MIMLMQYRLVKFDLQYSLQFPSFVHISRLLAFLLRLVVYAHSLHIYDCLGRLMFSGRLFDISGCFEVFDPDFQ